MFHERMLRLKRASVLGDCKCVNLTNACYYITYPKHMIPFSCVSQQNNREQE